jgi:hypothetical protein
MRWVAGIRFGALYTLEERPLDPRWSHQDMYTMLGWCATGQALGWTEERAFQTAEAIVMRSKNHGIRWPHINLNDDIETLLSISRKEHESQ